MTLNEKRTAIWVRESTWKFLNQQKSSGQSMDQLLRKLLGIDEAHPTGKKLEKD